MWALTSLPRGWTRTPCVGSAESWIAGHESQTYVFLFFLKYLFIFSWKTIALQYCVDFCHTSRWISRRYTYVPSLLNFPPTSLLILPLSVVTEHWVWAPRVTQQILTVCLTYGNINVSMLLSQFIPPSPSPTVPTHVFLFCLFVW